jgi:hypothetical protein
MRDAEILSPRHGIHNFLHKHAMRLVIFGQVELIQRIEVSRIVGATVDTLLAPQGV